MNVGRSKADDTVKINNTSMLNCSPVQCWDNTIPQYTQYIVIHIPKTIRLSTFYLEVAFQHCNQTLLVMTKSMHKTQEGTILTLGCDAAAAEYSSLCFHAAVKILCSIEYGDVGSRDVWNLFPTCIIEGCRINDTIKSEIYEEKVFLYANKGKCTVLHPIFLICY